MNTTTEKTDWGVIYNYRDKRSKFALYSYDDDDNTIYLSNVYITQSERGKGLGNKILETVEKESKAKRFNNICLKVLDVSWLHKWYSEHGYRDICRDEESEDYIWMIKQIVL